MLKAVTTNKLDEVVSLIEGGFPPDRSIDKKYGYNALQLAALTNHFPLIELLIIRGAAVNIRDQYGNTPLHLAVKQENREAIHSLLRHGADPSLQNNYGVTPIDKARSSSIKDFMRQFQRKQNIFPAFTVRL